MGKLKKAVFLAITIAMPFLLLALIEVGLRIGPYGGDMSAFDTPPLFKGRYRTPGRNVARRYFPRERVPPSPPADAFLVSKPAHSMRVFVLGESAAAGFPYPPNGTFSRVLRDALADVLPNDTVEVVNLGLAATNSFTIADLAGDVIGQKPDAVIIYGGHNEYYGALGVGSTESLGSWPAFVRLYLKLQRLRTFLLMRNAVTSLLATVRGGRSVSDIEADATRMESVVADQRITLGGKTYERGVRQYESNLRVAVGAFRNAGIPVFVGSTPSNLRDLAPFGTAAIPPDSTARFVFDSARARLARGDSINAGRMFAQARDLDVIRFRAPGEFEEVLKRVARDTKSVYTPVAEGFSAAAAYRIPGADLFLEHVHPNQRGYVLVARMYFDALRRSGFAGRRADMSRFAGWDSYASRMRLTALDHGIAYHTVMTVTTRWPFVPLAHQLDYRGVYKPSTFVDSLAFSVSRGGTSWGQAKVMLALRYAAAGKPDSALGEYEGLIRDQPQLEMAWGLAGRALLSAKQPQRARPYLERAYALEPTAFTSFALGAMAMQERNVPGAIALFEQSIQLDPNNPTALYQLSLAYAMTRDVEHARATALRLAQTEPRYPGLGELMAALGLTPR
ncbi:MAG: tetratricopeptide repeat protein [Gemmatimonadales bacterium]